MFIKDSSIELADIVVNTYFNNSLYIDKLDSLLKTVNSHKANFVVMSGSLNLIKSTFDSKLERCYLNNFVLEKLLYLKKCFDLSDEDLPFRI